ncbi:MAG TPA: Uma2 family endonuclease [Pyrinomonadaceae bacterium]|nr:Uma2 family endonuclease [Pyrinomonadaceae bacterium]
MATIEATFTKEELLSELSPETPFVLYGANWDSYEEVVQELWGVGSVQVIYNRGILKIMPKSPEHEYYAELVKRIVDRVSFGLHKKVISFGSPTMKKNTLEKGVEPDACFYVSRAALVSGSAKIDISEIPPDIVVEIDVYHKSDDKFEIYAAFGVPEFWLYDQKTLRIYRLEKDDKYEETSASLEFPILTSEILTKFLNQSRQKDQFEILLDFEDWLRKGKENN